jgi:MoaA/NifB/PqqE/SkfB family radical SAM enzyme
MGVPLIQQYRVGSYLVKQRLKKRERYPLVLMLEPLFQCNLACTGCGKIDHPQEILKRRMSVEDALAAVDECGAPVVSIPGGEPFLHDELPEIVRGIIDRKKFVYLCTNALLLSKKIAINCTLFLGEDPDEVADFFDEAMDLGIEGITISPGYSYSRAPRQDVFLNRRDSKHLFREIFRRGKGRPKKWAFNQSSLFLDFLAGNQDYQCTPWSNPTYNIFGWQKPCYLLVDEGYAETFEGLMEETPWERYGTGRNPKCDNCMAHCGYEGTAVDDTVSHPLKALRVALFGPDTEKPMVSDPPIQYLEDHREAKKLPIIKAG